MVRSSPLCSKNEKKFSDVTWPVISDLKNADLGGQNEFQTKMGNFDAVFFYSDSGNLTKCDFDHLNLSQYWKQNSANNEHRLYWNLAWHMCI